MKMRSKNNIMKLEKIKKELEKSLSGKRYRHSGGVADTAKHLAKLYGADADKAYEAGWVHDAAKELSLSDMQALIPEDSPLREDQPLMGSRALLHGPAGSIFIEKEFGIHDKEIQSAVYYHTTGHPQMTLLEKIVFLADYIEPSRDFPGVETLRKLAEKDLDKAVLAAYDSTISHLLDQEAYIYDLTFLGRNDLVLRMEKKA